MISGRKISSDTWWGYFFSLPFILTFAIFISYPLILSVKLSFLDINILQPEKARFVGIGNYVEALKDPLFWRSIFNVLYNQAIFIALSFVIALFLAVLLKEIRWGGSFFRTVYFLPVITSITVAMIMLEYLANPAGPIQTLLVQFGWIREGVFWTFSEWLPMPVLAVFNSWKWFGIQMIIFLGGLYAINPELYEAAAIDGAGWWRRLFSISLPQLKPQILFVLTVNLINGMQMFTEVFMNFDLYGGPYHAALTPVMYLYALGFDKNEMGYAATIGLLLAVVISILTFVQWKLLNRKGES
ncbi:permease [Marinithermofilum abyssi]|uniref:Permease n=1 Tax=Marinithermofilum abyssi TaxID=1571185 RepID=A0A8J2YC38_9BACL|nr:sugar ABC transporter permease [Marinithermofilum abyssi]GGE03924.1 permease [Marinithermofilum abyssi]